MPHAEGFGRRTDGPTGRRRAVRERLSLSVSLYSVEQSRGALLADMSQSGCRLQGMALPEVGQDVLLKAAEVELFGQIVWKDGAERGVKFEEPITEADLEELRQILCRQQGRETSQRDIISPEGRRRPRN